MAVNAQVEQLQLEARLSKLGGVDFKEFMRQRAAAGGKLPWEDLYQVPQGTAPLEFMFNQWRQSAAAIIVQKGIWDELKGLRQDMRQQNQQNEDLAAAESFNGQARYSGHDHS